MNHKRFLLGFLGVALVATLSARADNIVVDGGFEAPVIPLNSFAYFPSIPGWQLAFGPSIEVQSGVAGAPYQGNQFVELDSDASSGIYQDLSTVAGQSYDLTFAFSPRPFIAADENQLGVLWNGATVVDLGPVGGTSLTHTDWTVYNYQLKATGTSTRLEFEDLGPSDSLGTYVDSVSVITTPEPASFPLVAGGLLWIAATVRRSRKRQS
ncbi:MAG: DUF642 domain-containing protein [Terriglobia bacterium]